MTCKWYILHNWVDVEQISEREYLGEKYKTFYKSHRMCLSCKKVQEMTYDSQGFSWKAINKKEQEIVINRICRDGGHYVIRNQKDVETPPREE